VSHCLTDRIQALIDEYREPLGLDRWQVVLMVGEKSDPDDDSSAGCIADPEYRQARIIFSVDRLQTGDDLDEFVAHELVHALLWPLQAQAEEFAALASGLLPEYARPATTAKFEEDVRLAGEAAATDVGHAVLRYHRRLRDMRDACALLRRQLEALGQRPAA